MYIYVLLACPSLPDPMNIYGYLAPQYGGLRIRACPAGTRYSEAQCRCRTNNNGRSMRKQYRRKLIEYHSYCTIYYSLYFGEHRWFRV